MSELEHRAGAKHIAYIMAFYMLGAPLIWAMDQTLTVFFLQLSSLYALAWIVLGTEYLKHLPRGQLTWIVVIVMSMMIFLIPLPFDLWTLLPGRSQYGTVLTGISDGADLPWRPMSIVPAKTERAIWLLLPLVVTYVAVVSLPSHSMRRLINMIIAVAIFQSILGLVQYGSGVTLFNIVDSRYSNVATGTYLNRDHLAGFLEMAFPVVLALMAAKIGQHHQYASSRSRLLATLEGHQVLLYGLAAILIILCIVFTRSRSGVILTMVGLMLVLLAFSTRLGKANIYGSYGTVIAVSIILAIEIGLAPVLDRFSIDIMEDLRWELYATSMHGIAQFFPLGSGPGTYSSVYPAFQIPHHDFFINHAHNDYLEWIFEGGVLAMLIILAIGYFYFKQWKTVWTKGPWETVQYIQVGAGIGIFLMMLHSFVDFNLHKPVNAIYFVFLLAVFMRREMKNHPAA